MIGHVHEVTVSRPDGGTARRVSLDAFRGIAVAGMILVNTPGSWAHVHPPLAHADWHGCTPADLVFPFFLFAMGASMWFSLRRYDHRLSRRALARIARRAALLFLIGVALNSFPFIRDYETLRIPGVLQRIAVVYAFTAVLFLLIGLRGVLAVSALALAAYWLLLWRAGGGDPYSLEGNIVRRVDIALMGAGHLWAGKGVPFDPEGILSTVPAAVTSILGLSAAGVMGAGTDPRRQAAWLFLMGIACAGAGTAWNTAFPINKYLWTGSYVLFSGGWALIVLAALVLLIDSWRIRSWSEPFVIFGINPLFIFILSSLWVRILNRIETGTPDGGSLTAYRWLFVRIFAPAGLMNGSLLFALAHVAFFWLISYLLYRRRVIIKI